MRVYRLHRTSPSTPPSTPPRPAGWSGRYAGLLVLGFMPALALSALAQASSPAARPAPQNSHPQTANPKPAAGQAPAAAPMVLGQNPDDVQDGVADGASAAPAAPSTTAARSMTAAPPAASSPPAAAAPMAAPAVAGPSPAAAADAPLPVPRPANAGGDQARQQINDNCVNLLKMANSLKTSVDKSTQDELSLAVVRQADQIERLAHRMKDEMKPVIGKK